MAADNPNDPDYETTFTRRFKAWVAAVDRDILNEELEGKGFGPNNFSVPCVDATDADDDPPTGYLCDWQVPPDVFEDVIKPLLDSHTTKYTEQHESGKQIIRSNVAASDAKAGQVGTLAMCLTDFQVKRRVVEMGL